MQTPYRKPGKFSHLKPDPEITQGKFNELQAKLNHLKNHTRFKLMEEVRVNAENGDFSENASYQIAKGRLRGVNQRILDLEKQLASAIIIKPRTNSDQVQIGSRVTLGYEDKQRTYDILGGSETDPLRGIISYKSPLGSALMRHRVGDQVTIALASKTVVYKILKIE